MTVVLRYRFVFNISHLSAGAIRQTLARFVADQIISVEHVISRVVCRIGFQLYQTLT